VSKDEELKTRKGERVLLSNLKANLTDFAAKCADEEQYWIYVKQCYTNVPMVNAWSVNGLVYPPLVPLSEAATWSDERAAWVEKKAELQEQLQQLQQVDKKAKLNVGALFSLGIRGSSFYTEVFALFKGLKSSDCGMSILIISFFFSNVAARTVCTCRGRSLHVLHQWFQGESCETRFCNRPRWLVEVPLI
jgi:hypothetical protein